MPANKLARVVASAFLALGLLACGTAVAEEDAGQDEEFWRFNIGLRGWYRTLLFEGDSLFSEVRPIVQVGARAGNFVLGANYSPNAKYVATSNSDYYDEDPDWDVQEYDISLGYYVLPRLAVSLGYKGWTYPSSDGFDGYTEAGPFIGVSSSIPITGRFGIYGNLAYGRIKAEFGGSYNYAVIEPGVSFLFPSDDSAGLNAVVLTLGYRGQLFQREEDDFKYEYWFHGLNLGVSASF